MATPARTEGVGEAASYPSVRLSGTRILLAEDDPELRSLLVGILRGDGHEVVAVCDGRELIRVLARGSGGADFDLIVTDDRMPGWTGMQILTGLRSLHDSPPIVLITAFADESLRARAVVLGAAAVLDKPLDCDDLRAVVCNLLTPRTG